MQEEHWRRLERLYLNAPTNAYYEPKIRIGDRTCEIEIAARRDFHHAADAVHGSVYFKMLDDAAFFAANSIVEDVLVLTSDFTIHLLRPVVEGTLVARGKLVHAGARQLLAESQLYGPGEALLAHGVGTFVRSKLRLSSTQT